MNDTPEPMEESTRDSRSMPAGQGPGWKVSERATDTLLWGWGVTAFHYEGWEFKVRLRSYQSQTFIRLVNNCDICEPPFVTLYMNLCVCFCRSEEKIKHFSQLKSELFLQDNTLSKILCLITELRVAAQRNFILKRLFWKVSVLFFVFKTSLIWLSNLTMN